MLNRITKDLLVENPVKPEHIKILSKIYSSELVLKSSFQSAKEMKETVKPIVDSYSAYFKDNKGGSEPILSVL
jgi:hypothetical protein